MNNTLLNSTQGAVSKPKKAPVVKQTLTSKYRLLKANPVLVHELTKKIDPQQQFAIKPLKTLVAAWDDAPRKSTFVKPNVQKAAPINKPKTVMGKKMNGVEPMKITKGEPPKLKPRNPIHTPLMNGIEQMKITKVNGREPPKPKPQNPIHTPLAEIKNSNRNNTVFKTPRSSLKVARLSTPTASEMSKKLGAWLKQKSKSITNYHHLKCFDLGSIDNKENALATEENDHFNNNNTETVAREALIDLHKLISEGYPSDQCDIWLKLIKQKCNRLEEEPQYWECRAALEQSKGDIVSAVECCKNAIVQGAQVRSAEAFLDQLLHKFSLLNIAKEAENGKDRTKIVTDARNVFKSSIIQFAVQEKTLKKKTKDGVTMEKSLVATPVRRSTRFSRSAYTCTPGVTLYSSLQDVEPAVRDSIRFKNNVALLE